MTQAADRKHRWDDINGIAFRKGSAVLHTAARDFVQNLDTLPAPARHQLALGRYRALGMPVSLITSRGCPFKCIFCVGRKMVGAKVRYRNPQGVVDEMQYLTTLNFHQINIADDLFTANKTHCMAVCDEIIKRKARIKWTSFARVDTVTEEILTCMKAAGCTGVSFGIESGNEKILKTIKKGISHRQVVDAVKMCHRAGVTPYGSFILGLPGETPQTIDETLEFGKQLKRMGLSFGFHLLAPTAQDTLDFTGPATNSGSRLILLATRRDGEPLRREHPPVLSSSDTMHPAITDITHIGPSFLIAKVPDRTQVDEVKHALAEHKAAKKYLFHILVSDDVDLKDRMSVLWGWFTRFDPVLDMHPAKKEVIGNRLVMHVPIGIDATWKEGYPKPVSFDPEVEAKVNNRWKEFGLD